MDYHISTASLTAFIVLTIWDLVWRGLALWRASQHKSKVWFVVLLVINSAGILPICYLLVTGGIPEKKQANV